MLIAEFTHEGPPKSKERPRHTRNGHTYTPTTTLDAEEAIRWAFRAGTKHGAFPVPREQNLSIELDFYLPDRRGRDWDNLGKTVCDALNGIAYADDSQIKDARVRLRVDKERPRTVVRVHTLEED